MLEGEPETAHDPAGETGREDDGFAGRSLADDLEALYEDGRTYVEAELAYQKTRARFVSSLGKTGAAYGLLAILVLHLVLVGLVVGSILTLSPLVGPLLATGIVVGVLLIAVVVFAMGARARFRRIAASFGRSER